MSEPFQRPPLFRLLLKPFSDHEAAVEELVALLNPEARTEEEIGIGTGGIISLSLMLGMFTSKLVYFIRTPNIEVAGEAAAHGWTTYQEETTNGTL